MLPNKTFSYTPVYGLKPDVTSLDDDLRNQRAAKYDSSKILEIKTWITNLLQNDPILSNYNLDHDLIDLLRDGIILCSLINTITRNTNKNEIKIKFRKSNMPFIQMENIDFFLKSCKKIGVPQDELFSTVDLFEKKDPAQIYTTLISLSRYSNKLNPSITIIGPKLAEKRIPPSIPKKPKYLKNINNSNSWSTFEYGYMNGANQNTESILLGGDRNIIRGNNKKN
ncbi:Scp1p ASCRUDRAFT_74083 [Ascoidea rubescens DSM 1968]|uniref:Calponin-homology (CH) domain-containing protein n=1 Tax=Ascoidea rubescens DSM 1968 TaxID=1344418 RepID=A0A1D2VS80_9ASCO|nr:hypothetical protein ASCRUDRAFT_74083 [Ascoidea rubescens DSM 1968]ODV64464.1 hypothetical protein ASCRUDRAFT_74083 [Ascoidea rubescens DSM 1968]